MNIRSIRHKGLERYIETGDSRGIQHDLVTRIRRVVTSLGAASSAETMLGPPGWRIHQLSGDRTGTWSISVSGNWRITFEIEDGDVLNLDLEDYH